MVYLETENQSRTKWVGFLESVAVSFDQFASLAIRTLLVYQSYHEAFQNTDISC